MVPRCMYRLHAHILRALSVDHGVPVNKVRSGRIPKLNLVGPPLHFTKIFFNEVVVNLVQLWNGVDIIKRRSTMVQLKEPN